MEVCYAHMPPGVCLQALRQELRGLLVGDQHVGPPVAQAPIPRCKYSHSLTLESLTHNSLTHSLTHSLLTHSLTHSLTHPPTHSPTHPLTHSLTHSLLTHSLLLTFTYLLTFLLTDFRRVTGDVPQDRHRGWPPPQAPRVGAAAAQGAPGLLLGARRRHAPHDEAGTSLTFSPPLPPLHPISNDHYTLRLSSPSPDPPRSAHRPLLLLAP